MKEAIFYNLQIFSLILGGISYVNLCSVKFMRCWNSAQQQLPAEPYRDYGRTCEVDAKWHRTTRTPPTNSPSLDLIAELCIVTTQKVLRYLFLKIPLDIVHDRRKAICPTSATLWWHRRTVGQRVWVSPGRHRLVPWVFRESPMNQLSPHVLSEDWTFKTCSRVFCEHGYFSVFSYFLKSVLLVSFC